MRVIHLAQQAAERMGAPVVGTEHLLLALAHDNEGLAVRILRQFGVNPVRVQAAYDSEPLPAEAGNQVDADKLSFSPSANHALARGIQECTLLLEQYRQHDAVDTEHLLLGLLRAGAACNSGKLLQRMEIDPERLIIAILNALPYRRRLPGTVGRVWHAAQTLLTALACRVQPLPVKLHAVAPSPNAYDYFMAAGAMLVECEQIQALKVLQNEPADAHLEERTALLGQHAAVLAKIREGFAYAFRYPDIMYPLVKFSLLKEMHQFYHLFEIEAQLYIVGGDYAGAMRSFVDGIRITMQFPHGGLRLTHLSGNVFERIFRNRLRAITPHLNAEQTRWALKTLEALELQRTSYANSIIAASCASMRMLNDLIDKPEKLLPCIPEDLPSRQALQKFATMSSRAQRKTLRHEAQRMYQQSCMRAALPYASKLFPCPQTSDELVNEVIAVFYPDKVVSSQLIDTEARLLAAYSLLGLALQAYAYAYASYPSHLAELVPAYLTRIPLDPFTLYRPMRYHRIAHDVCTIYSIGPEGDVPANYRLTIRLATHVGDAHNPSM